MFKTEKKKTLMARKESKIVEVINELGEINGRNDKIKLISENQDILRKILFYTYNPNYNFYMKKIGEVGTGSLIIEEKLDKLWELLDSLRQRKITGNNAKDAVLSFLSNLEESSQDIVESIIRKDLRIGASIKTINKAIPGLFDEFSVQLANKYNPDKDYKVKGFYASPKLDGIRCYFKENKLFSRNGKEITGFDKIKEELKKFDLDFIDGELFCEDMSFQEITGIVSRKVNISKEEDKIKFYVFAIGHKDISNTKDMIEMMDNLFKDSEYIKLIEYKKIKNDVELINKLTLYYVKKGYEGLMLRSPSKYYDFKRSDALLKVKLFKECDLKIVDMIEGTGKYKEMLGALVCEGEVEDNYIEVEVGTGFTDVQREDLWATKDEIIGSFAEIKYFQLTDDNSSLRFPVFKKLND